MRKVVFTIVFFAIVFPVFSQTFFGTTLTYAITHNYNRYQVDIENIYTKFKVRFYIAHNMETIYDIRASSPNSSVKRIGTADIYADQFKQIISGFLDSEGSSDDRVWTNQSVALAAIISGYIQERLVPHPVIQVKPEKIPVKTSWSKSDLQNMYLNYLQEEGYRPNIDEDGDVHFKSEGDNYYIIVNDDDPEFFQLLYPNFWEIESEDERIDVALAASYATMQTKVAKIYLTDYDDTSVSVEIYLNNPEDFKTMFPRMLSAIDTALNAFYEWMD
ncbi:hypothetical protein FACS1894164_09820 [Spirochaetia bacterium]|nr:hypothetical protein FACS1894164_09820 [Spirochaetia bacterium]